MTLKQCEAIVLFGRDATGNRGGLIAPRKCQRVANHGRYCGLHHSQADLQDLLREILVPGWEYRVATWLERREREAVKQTLPGVERLADLAARAGHPQLASFFRMRRQEFALTLVKASR